MVERKQTILEHGKTLESRYGHPFKVVRNCLENDYFFIDILTDCY